MSDKVLSGSIDERADGLSEKYGIVLRMVLRGDSRDACYASMMKHGISGELADSYFAAARQERIDFIKSGCGLRITFALIAIAGGYIVWDCYSGASSMVIVGGVSFLIVVLVDRIGRAAIARFSSSNVCNDFFHANR